MNPYLGFRCARIVLLVLLGSIFLSLASGRPSLRRPRILIFGVLIAALLSYPNFGFFHASWGHIHYWDAFHYFMGAKYLPELGYSRLYETTFVAGRELGGLGPVTHLRDLTTYSYRGVDSIDAQAIRGRFSQERWLMFKRDLAFFSPHLEPWPGPLLDHGNNDPPPRALLLHILLRWIPANLVTLTLLTSLDYLLVIAAYGLVRRAFGEIPTALAFAFFSLSFFARFDFLGGSILRWDWIAALLIGLAAFARGFGGTAGIFFGYAALARIFPILFLVPLGMKWLQGRLGGTRDKTLGRCLCTAVALVLVVALGLAATAETNGFLPDYVSKIHLHNTIPSTNRVGLGSLLAVHSALWGFNPDGSVYVLQEELVAARPAPYVLPLISTLYLLAAVPLIRRARPLESVMYAVPLIFCALSPTGYYYSFLVLLVLLPWQRGSTDSIRLLEMAFLTLNMAVSYAFELTSDGWLSLFYQASIQMGLFFLFWLGFEYVRLGAGAARLTTVSASLNSTRAAT